MDKFREYIESAIKNIRSNRLRTLLTMLGIIIGIAAVIAIITLGNGMKVFISDEVNSLASNMVDIYIDTTKTTDYFTQDDADAIEEEYPGITGTSFQFGYEGIGMSRKGAKDVGVMGVSPAYEYSSAGGLMSGRYFTRDELDLNAHVCVIMENDAKKLFGTSDAIGMNVELNVNGHISEMEVIGIRNNYNDMIMKLLEAEEYPIIVEIPYTTLSSAFAIDVSEKRTMEIYMKPDQSSDIVNKAVSFLEVKKNLRGQDALYYYSSNDDSDQIDTMMSAVTGFLALVAAISLIVGGVGVMNIMLVSVTERTREIGIRKSIGARTSSILIQFLAESSIISLTGGIIGVILGIIIAAIACHVLNFKFIVSLSSVLTASFFSIVIGLFFGIYPARKAARLKPVDALAAR